MACSCAEENAGLSHTTAFVTRKWGVRALAPAVPKDNGIYVNIRTGIMIIMKTCCFFFFFFFFFLIFSFMVIEIPDLEFKQ